MEPQVDKNEHLRHLLLFEFNKGSKASEAVRATAQDGSVVFAKAILAWRTNRTLDDHQASLKTSWMLCCMKTLAQQPESWLQRWDVSMEQSRTICIQWERSKNSVHGSRMSLRKQTKMPVFPFAPHCLHGTDWLGKKGGFSFAYCYRWWKMVSMWILSDEKSGSALISKQLQGQNRTSIHEKQCCAFGGTWKELFTMNC